METRFVEGPAAPPALAQRREEDDHGVVAAPAAHRVAPRAGVRLVEAVAAADARELARDRLELLRLPVVLAVREDAARANVVLREALLSQEAAEARRAGRAGLVIEPPRPGAAPVLGAAEVVQEARLVVSDSGGVGVREHGCAEMGRGCREETQALQDKRRRNATKTNAAEAKTEIGE